MEICRKVKNARAVVHIGQIRAGELFQCLNEESDYMYIKIKTDTDCFANAVRLNDGLLVHIGTKIDIVKIDGELLID